MQSSQDAQFLTTSFCDYVNVHHIILNKYNKHERSVRGKKKYNCKISHPLIKIVFKFCYQNRFLDYFQKVYMLPYHNPLKLYIKGT